ncbi:MAG: cellulase N-terminal Ig-like domain-containing protein, partial [Cyanobacteria bacterium P01_F01_bin.3]
MNAPTRVFASSSHPVTQTAPAQIYAVRPDILAVEVAPPTVTLGRQMPYVAEPGDRIITRNKQSELRRNGKPIGILVGASQGILYTDDEVSERSFRIAYAEVAERYSIRPQSDKNYAVEKTPITVARKTKPMGLSRSAEGGRQWLSGHTLYLTLPRPMQLGKRYQLRFSELGLADGEFMYAPMSAHSEAVHVSQLGFRPADPFKVGYLSTWMGSGGSVDYPDGLNFSLVESGSGQPVYRSVAMRRRGSTQREGPRNRDYTLSEVHQLDFSDFSEPGEYRLCVESVG